MNRTQFIEHVIAQTTERIDLLRSKGEAYSGNEDAFANFKRNGERLGLTKFQIWAVYCSKHLDAIFGAIRANPNWPRDKSEGMQGRIDDTINYLNLLSGMLKEGVSLEEFIPVRSVPSNEEIAKEITQLALAAPSQNQSTELVKEKLDGFYGPRNFSL